MLRFHYKKIMGDIADALRTRLGTSNRYKVKDIPQSIIDIPSGVEFTRLVDCIEFTGKKISSTEVQFPNTTKTWRTAMIIPKDLAYATIDGMNTNGFEACILLYVAKSSRSNWYPWTIGKIGIRRDSNGCNYCDKIGTGANKDNVSISSTTVTLLSGSMSDLRGLGNSILSKQYYALFFN